MHRVWLLVLLVLPITHALTINEVMYHSSSGNSGEWIEIYNNDSVSANLSEFKIYESSLNRTIRHVSGSEIINQNEFATIAKDTTQFLLDWPGYNGSLFNSTFSLVDSGEEINLRNSSLDTVDNFTYSDTLGGAGNNNTICRYPEGNTSLSECLATPGYANVLFVPQNSTSNNTNTTNTTQSNTTSSDCDLSLTISAASDILNPEQQMDYDLIVNDTSCGSTQHNITIDYTIEDLFGAAVSTFPKNTVQGMTCSKTIGRQWTPQNVVGSEAYIIKADITGPGCNETNTANNNASKIVIVKGSLQPAVCPPVTTCTQSSGSSGGGGGGSSYSASSSQAVTFTITITDYKGQIAQGEEFETLASIFNNYTTPKNFSVYSYVYEGSEPVSLGYSSKEDKWMGTFDANEKTLEIPARTSLTVMLKNMIENDTAPGDYSFRVRARTGTTIKDITRTITVTPSQIEELQIKTTLKIDNQTGEENEATNVTEEKETTLSENRITGFAVARPFNMNFMLSPVAILMNFLLDLF